MKVQICLIDFVFEKIKKGAKEKDRSSFFLRRRAKHPTPNLFFPSIVLHMLKENSSPFSILTIPTTLHRLV